MTTVFKMQCNKLCIKGALCTFSSASLSALLAESTSPLKCKKTEDDHLQHPYASRIYSLFICITCGRCHKVEQLTCIQTRCFIVSMDI